MPQGGAIGKDVKLMAKDRSIIHGSRARKTEGATLTQEQLKKLSKARTNPNAIYKDNATGNLISRYSVSKVRDSIIVFAPKHDLVSVALHTFSKQEEMPLTTTREDVHFYGRNRPPSLGFEPSYILDIAF